MQREVDAIERERDAPRKFPPSATCEHRRFRFTLPALRRLLSSCLAPSSTYLPQSHGSWNISNARVPNGYARACEILVSSAPRVRSRKGSTGSRRLMESPLPRPSNAPPSFEFLTSAIAALITTTLTQDQHLDSTKEGLEYEHASEGPWAFRTFPSTIITPPPWLFFCLG